MFRSIVSKLTMTDIAVIYRKTQSKVTMNSEWHGVMDKKIASAMIMFSKINI